MPPRRPAHRSRRPPLDPDTLEVHDEPLVPDETYDRVVVRGVDLTRAQASGSRFLECALVDVDLTEADLSGARFSEGVLTRVRGAGVDLSDATLADLTVTDPRLGALAAYGSVWRDVRVVGGKVDFLNLRGATLTDVADALADQLGILVAT
ncbi:MAG: pentapeptide repeat-containing protein [Actinomycetota bacterium]|nr:pentapeptide repeat-containing protein [Actinomycetota bacterium]